LRRACRRYGLPLRVIPGWTHAFAPLGTPLIDRRHVAGAVSAFLDHLVVDKDQPKLLLLTYLAEDGPVAAAFDGEIARRGLRQARFDRHARALLAPASDAGSYLAVSLGKKRRHELQRQRRRLGEGAVLACQVESAPERIAPILAEFLALEAAGWKGRAGTAAAQRPDIARFVSAAVTGLAADGKVMAACLRHDGRAIATMIVLRSGAGAWGWKIAYDESLARFSPGVQLLADVTERLIGQPDVAWTDSCAIPGHSMMDHIWRERRIVADRLIALNASAHIAAASRLEALRRGALGLARRLRNRMRG
jgi:CelD/BcsL family acetyltransferase involved in cellulose biosynthesis